MSGSRHVPPKVAGQRSYVVIYRFGSVDGFDWRVIPMLHSKEEADYKARNMTSQNWTAKAWPAGKAAPKDWEGTDGTSKS
jgi:hypothetical protein